jgi:hypothetical protein
VEEGEQSKPSTLFSYKFLNDDAFWASFPVNFSKVVNSVIKVNRYSWGANKKGNTIKFSPL